MRKKDRLCETAEIPVKRLWKMISDTASADVAVRLVASYIVFYMCFGQPRHCIKRLYAGRAYAESRDRFLVLMFICHADIFFKMIYTEITTQQSESARIIYMSRKRALSIRQSSSGRII
jgi:hypothetical protein